MPCMATLRQSGGSIILSIPKTIAQTLGVEAGSVVELTVEGRTLSVALARLGLADRLAKSPKTPGQWQREDDSMQDGPVGRKLL